MAWVNNGWVVGIGSGLVSGFAVFWILRLFLSKKDDREYQQRTASADKEVMYAIRPGISEGQLPDREVVGALIRATARRYSVSPEDLYLPHEFAEELIKEVMDSSFLSAAKKREYCDQLATIGVPATPQNVEGSGQSHSQTQEFSDYRRKTNEMLATVVGVMAGLLSAGVGIAAVSPKLLTWFRAVKEWHFGTIVAVPIFISVTSVLIVQITDILRRMKELREVRIEKSAIIKEIEREVEAVTKNERGPTS